MLYEPDVRLATKHLFDVFSKSLHVRFCLCKSH